MASALNYRAQLTVIGFAFGWLTLGSLMLWSEFNGWGKTLCLVAIPGYLALIAGYLLMRDDDQLIATELLEAAKAVEYCWHNLDMTVSDAAADVGVRVLDRLIAAIAKAERRE